MTPADKAEAVRTLEQNHHRVLFIGDGLNDTEAMAAATCSIALEGGSRSACEIAHASLPPEALEQIPLLLDIARDCRSAIRHILLFAIGYNLLGITAAASGLLSPALAAILMFASSLTVLTLAVRSSRPQMNAFRKSHIFTT
jgi:P-type E1-E2 ATPase